MNRRQHEREALPAPYVTYILLAVNALLFAAMWQASRGQIVTVMTAFGDKDNALIRAGESWRLITPIFLHGSLPHLLVNSMSLLMIGLPMEQMYGARKYFLIYMAGGIVGFIASFYRSEVPSLGASGALFGLVGAGLVFPIRYRSLIDEKARTHFLRQLLVVALVNIGFGFALPGLHVDNYAHMGGLVGGGFAALFLLPEALDDPPRRRVNEFAVTLAVVVALATVGWAGYRQWRWKARWDAMTALPVMHTFSPPGKDPWWSLGIPQNWTQEPGEWRWRSPRGAVVRVIDSDRDAEAINALLQQAGPQLKAQFQQAGPKPIVQIFLIDGKPGYHFTIQTPQRLVDFYLIQAYNRTLGLVLECPPTIYRDSQREFLFIVSSMRFVHPPEGEAKSGAPIRGEGAFPSFPMQTPDASR